MLAFAHVSSTQDESEYWKWLKLNNCKIRGLHFDYFGPSNNIRGLSFDTEDGKTIVPQIQVDLHKSVVWTTEVAFSNIQLQNLLQSGPSNEPELDEEGRIISVRAGNCSESCYRIEPSLFLVSHIAVEKEKKEASFWRPFLDMFPAVPMRASYIIAASESCDATLISDAQKIKKSFARSRFATRILEQEVAELHKQTIVLAHLFKASNQFQFIDDKFRCTLLWAGAVLNTRAQKYVAFAEDQVSKFKSVALIPVFDLFNMEITEGAPDLFGDLFQVMADGSVRLKQRPHWNRHLGLTSQNTHICAHKMGGTFVTEKHLKFVSHLGRANNEVNNKNDGVRPFGLGCAELQIGGETFEINLLDDKSFPISRDVLNTKISAMLSTIAIHDDDDGNSQVLAVDLLSNLISARIHELPPLDVLVDEVVIYQQTILPNKDSDIVPNNGGGGGVIDVKYQNVVGSVLMALEYLTLKQLQLKLSAETSELRVRGLEL